MLPRHLILCRLTATSICCTLPFGVRLIFAMPQSTFQNIQQNRHSRNSNVGSSCGNVGFPAWLFQESVCIAAYRRIVLCTSMNQEPGNTKLPDKTAGGVTFQQLLLPGGAPALKALRRSKPAATAAPLSCRFGEMGILTDASLENP